MVTAPTPTPSSDVNADETAAEHSRPPGARGQVLTYSSLPSLVDARARAQPVEPTRTHAPEPAAAASDAASGTAHGPRSDNGADLLRDGRERDGAARLTREKLGDVHGVRLGAVRGDARGEDVPVGADREGGSPRASAQADGAPEADAIALRVTSPVLGSISIAAGAPSSSVTPKAMNLPVLGSAVTLCRRTVSSKAAAASTDHAATPSAGSERDVAPAEREQVLVAVAVDVGAQGKDVHAAVFVPLSLGVGGRCRGGVGDQLPEQRSVAHGPRPQVLAPAGDGEQLPARDEQAVHDVAVLEDMAPDCDEGGAGGSER